MLNRRCLPTAFLLFLALFLCTSVSAQNGEIKGLLVDADDLPVIYANVALYADSNLVKVETTDDAGLFRIVNVQPGDYVLTASYLGAPDLNRELTVTAGMNDLEVLKMAPAAVELAEATVVAKRAMVEVKPDRTVFNVQGTINAVGDNGLDLLRKAPGVTIDNNDNINVLSRSGVLVYIDGKRSPLSGDELSGYLRSLTAEQIDRIDIITNPGAKYEAEGNAGIIDIRLVKNENEGANGSANFTATQAFYNRINGSVTGNYRNSKLNTFGSVGFVDGENFNVFNFVTQQNELETIERTRFNNTWNNVNYRFGTDFFLSKKHTVGFLINGLTQEGVNANVSNVSIAAIGQPVDSVLVANSVADDTRDQTTYNLNYRYDIDKDKSLNVDLDYGRFRNTSVRTQPNVYFSPSGEVLTEIVNEFDTPRDIDIYTFQTDYEQPLAGGQFGAGIRLSRVSTNNTFLFFDLPTGSPIRNDDKSNLFDYTENVYAGYLSYQNKFNEKWSYSAGLRTEQTDAEGDLTTFNSQEADPVQLNYLSFFPSAGLTYALNQQKGNTLALNYSRRINRPDYNVLNPFRNQISQLSFELGNPDLQPEIVDNIELGYTLNYRYNFKLAFSETSNQITRLIGPDPEDDRAGFISWDNLASNTVVSFNASIPVTVTKWWNAFFNINAAHINNQADYGENGSVDVQVFTYNGFTQHTFTLPAKITAELSGFYSGPGVWGGVFEYEPIYQVNFGFQRRFLNDQLNVKLSANDIFWTQGFKGGSSFNGQVGTGRGRWDSRNVALALSYNFGNQKVKSRRRDTGLGKEAQRAGQ
ncbi:TonB-dependent receptor domain-containing protein [Lewinella sp. 4G2]|uniref:TonB-dependent receptor domain-containing protein n=1 Tax=Lewinella sp. 4G2 TaxID=1803372 RepID=UPI0007B4B154|nr:TonB-dependent receptor [Lewinella sp. 4G2]OAV46133.1 hypothetical protein A3850_017895 [Lewinella sp. 4G2]